MLELVFALEKFAFTTSVQEKLIISSLHPKTPLKRSIYQRSFEDYDNGITYDYIFLGSSHCYRGLNPKQFEETHLKAINLGNTSQTPAVSYAIAKHYHNTKNFILEVYPVVAATTSNESFRDMLVSTPNYLLLTDLALEIAELQNFHLLLEKNIIEDKLKSDTLASCIYYKGFVTVTDSACNRNFTYDSLFLKTELIDQQLKYVEKLTLFCKKKALNLILVYAPVPSKLKLVNENYYLTELTKISKKYKLLFLNYGRKSILHDQYHFYDDDHLNQTGVEVFNKVLICDLKKYVHEK